MLPRKTTITRLMSLAVFIFIGMWVWVVSTNNTRQPSDMLQFPRELGQSLFTRNNTPHSVPNKTEPQISHHHNNESMKILMKNMTILKANETDLRNIIRQVNQSIPYNLTKLANPHPFQYILNTERLCKGKDIFVVAYIHTSPDHYKRRMVIRQTWGNPKYYGDTIIRVVFIMGKKFDKPEVQNALAFESEQYGDIVQEDFEDTYKNLTYKGVAGLKWVSKYCNKAKFVLKSDDDIFVNMFTLLKHLKSLQEHSINNKGLIMCLVWNRMKVMRSGKWKVSEEDFKDDFYPTYCSGSAFTLSTDVAIALHNISYHVPFFWVDDFYITGLLPLKLGLKHKQFMSTYVLDGRKLEEKFTGPQWFTYIFSHVHNLNSIQSVWERLVKLTEGIQVPVKYALPGQLPNEAEIKAKEEEEKKKKAEERKKKDEERKKKEEKAKLKKT